MISVTVRLCAIIVFTSTFLCSTIGTIYYVIPDVFYPYDGYSVVGNNNSTTLQIIIDHADEYFISNTRLLLLPGQHNLNSDIMIYNVHNFSIVGSETDGEINSTIQCTSSAGIAVVNCSYTFLTNLKIVGCSNEYKEFVDLYASQYSQEFKDVGLLLLNCRFVSIINVHILSQNIEISACGIQILNILGKSMLNNISVNCLAVFFDAIDSGATSSNELYIDNFQGLKRVTNMRMPSIFILLSNALYSVKIFLINSNFGSTQAFHFYCKNFHGHSFITVSNCNFTKVKNQRIHKMVWFSFKNCANPYSNLWDEVIINKCHFSSIRAHDNGELLGIHIKQFTEDLTNDFQRKRFIITVANCTFNNIWNLNVILVAYSTNHTVGLPLPNVMFKNISVTNVVIKNESVYYTLFLYEVELYLEGPIILKNIHTSRGNKRYYIIRSTQDTYVQISGYLEISHCVATYAVTTSEIHIAEFSTLNFTANRFLRINPYTLNQRSGDATSMLLSQMFWPCIFQYISSRGNLDNDFLLNKPINYLILFNNNDIHKFSPYTVTRCGWNQHAAFLKSNPRLVNKKIIKYINDSLQNYTLRKQICYCGYEDLHEDCYRDELGSYYPWQLIDFYFLITGVPFPFQSILIKIEDGPDFACSSSSNRSVITEVYVDVCTKLQYTIKFTGSQECDLYLKVIPQPRLGHSVSSEIAIIEIYYINLFACPVGFTLLDGSCKCDSILHFTVYACDINDQIIVRHANSWISGKTVNNSHSYSVSEQCPFDYCLPYASRLNLLYPDSQCQFNRTGLLCGQCQYDLSTVFGSSECKRCSNVYLLIFIPFGITGILLVLSVFILNLTVRDGDINSFLLYVNIVSINTPIFLPNHKKYEYTFISLANLDLGITTCFYNGMDDYAKVWLQLAFPLYLIVIAVVIIIASRHSLRVLRLTANKGVSVLATLFVMSYTKVLCTLSNALFLYSKITNLPSAHSFQVWGVNTDIPIFSLKFSIMFCGFGLLLLLLALFNATLLFARILNFKLLSQLKYLLYYVCQAAYKDKYFYWTGLQLMLRAVFLGLSALDRNINLMISSLLIGAFACFHATAYPFKNKLQNIQELFMLMNLHALFITSLYSESNYTAVEVLISLSALYFFMIIVKHMRNYSCKRFYEDKFLCKAKELTTKIAKKLTAKTEMGNNMELLVGVNNNNCNEF